MTLREGWNFTGDIANMLEAICRKRFGLMDARAVNSTILKVLH